MAYLSASDIEGNRISGLYGHLRMGEIDADCILPDFKDWEVVVAMENKRAFSLRNLCVKAAGDPIFHSTIRVEEWSGELKDIQRFSDDEANEVCGLQIIKIVWSKLMTFKIGLLLESRKVLTFGVSEVDMSYTISDFSKDKHFLTLQKVNIISE